MNTKVSIDYSDANNFKGFREVVFAGEFDPKRVKRVVGKERQFIPEEVGIDRIYIESASGLPTSDDLVFHELSENGFELTDEEPTDTRTIDEFLDAIEKAPMDEGAAMQQLFSDGMQVYRVDESDCTEYYGVLTKDEAIAYMLGGEIPDDVEWERF